MANNLIDGLNELAQGFQKRFKVSDKLTLQDMIDLVTPLPFPSGINLLDKPIAKTYNSDSVSFKVKNIPPAMNVPITLEFSVSSGNYGTIIEGPYLIINVQDGTQKKLFTSGDVNDPYEKTSTFKIIIPANTVIADNTFILKVDITGSLYFTSIDKIIATYRGG